jgi:DNA-binding response OmpR family regulator
MSKILVLDDNRDILEAVTFILGKRRKMDVVTLNDPSLLHLFLKEHKPDVLLMDVCLGDYDGMDLCRQIKKRRQEKQKTAIVLFTAKTCTDAAITTSLADAFIEKPFHINQLYTVVEKFLPQ